MASGLALLGGPTKTFADEPMEPIVGGWELTLSLGGTITDYIFEQFHSDGTEIENDITDVLSGNVCMGVWEKLRDGVWVHRNPLFILAVMAVLVGVQLLATGIIAELIIRTYYESQGKRAYSISARAGFDDETSI